MSLSNFFSTRSWNGFAPAVSSFASSVIVFDVLAWLAWHNGQHRPFDIIASFIGFPAVLATMLLIAGLAWSFAGRIPLTQAIGWGLRLLPLSWAIPLIDFVRLTGSGTASIVPYMNGFGILKSIFTAGIFPLDSGLPIGIRFGIAAATFGAGILCWHLSKNVLKTGLSVIGFSFVSTMLISAVSLAIFFNAPFEARSWSAPAIDIARRATMILGKGYWWTSIYDRFPTAIDNQIDIATRLFSAVGALSVLSILVCFIALSQRTLRRLLKYIFGSWYSVLFFSSIVVGLVVAYRDAEVGYGFGFLPAFIFFVFISAGLRVASVFRRDIANLERDEREGRHQPILDGVIELEDAKTAALAGEACSVAMAFALGWPVALMVLGYLGCAKFSRDRVWGMVGQASSTFRAIGSSALAGFAYLFLTQDVKLTSHLLMAMGIAAAIRLLIEWFWIPKFKGIGYRR